MPTPYPFQAGATLLASQMNSLSELPIRSITSSATAVATDAYSRVIANGSAITYTLPNNTFGTAQVIEFHNANSSPATIAAGAGVTLNGADVLTVSQWQGGEIYFSSPSTAIFFPTAKTVSAGGLVYLTGASFTTATSFSLPTSTFSSTYRNYKLIVQITAVTSDADFTMRLRASGSDDTNNAYGYNMPGYSYAGAASNSIAEAQTSFILGEQDNSIIRYFADFDIIAPELATPTYFMGSYNFLNKAAGASIARSGVMHFTNATQFDSLSFISSVASSITGVYRVYGYADS